MPTRIYSLAKDLNIDGKKLVELCTKAGIQGKGSALASLEDDEVVKMKAYLDAGAAKQAAAPAAPIGDFTIEAHDKIVLQAQPFPPFIEDIIEQSITLQYRARRTGILGSAVIQDKVTEIIDVDEIVRLAATA